LETPWFDGGRYHRMDDDDDDDEDPLCKQVVECGNFDADPPRLLYVVDLDRMRTTRTALACWAKVAAAVRSTLL